MKRGFTLIELLAVITILAIILLIIVPLVTSIIKTSKDSSNEKSVELYGRAIENAVANYFLKHSEKNMVTLQQLEDENMLEYKGSKVECEIVQISKMNVYLKNCKVNNKDIDYIYGNFDPAPELNDKLIPVEYRDNEWIVVDSNTKTWYDYDKQKWANAVTLLPGVTKDVGDKVAVDGTEASMMYVWIPRYEYKIEGKFGKGGTKEQPGEIDINFISSDQKEPSSNDYKIHPAFTFGDKYLNGIWVSKFEMSSIDDGASSTGLRVLPNMLSLTSKRVSNFFFLIKNLSSEKNDYHMIKNSEWGAVAYLSQSKYGKYGNKDYEGVQREVYINNSGENTYTGRSGGNPGGNTKIKDTYTDQTETEKYSAYGFYTYDGYLVDYNTGNKTEIRNINKGTGASTTGNIYGIYDMSGGAYEYVMGVFGNDEKIYTGINFSSHSGFNGLYAEGGERTDGAAVPDSKYYNKYVASICDETCLGHALSETEEWYNDRFDIVLPSQSWFVRGGNALNGIIAGIFDATHFDGSKSSGLSMFTTRAILVSN